MSDDHSAVDCQNMPSSAECWNSTHYPSWAYLITNNYTSSFFLFAYLATSAYLISISVPQLVTNSNWIWGSQWWSGYYFKRASAHNTRGEGPLDCINFDWARWAIPRHSGTCFVWTLCSKLLLQCCMETVSTSYRDPMIQDSVWWPLRTFLCIHL
jgi:hypothetical protein